MNAIMDMASPSYKMRFMYMAGYDNEAKFDRFKRKFTLEPIAGKLKCPVLVQAGDDDELSPIEFSDELVAKIKTPKKFVVYEGERHAIGGGSAAYLGENWFTMLADWCRDRIDGKTPPHERVQINALGQPAVTRYR
jgi:alpha-beta hydrolase superfamily lysophospholipase